MGLHNFQNIVYLSDMDYNGEDTEDARTIFCGNLHIKVTEELLYELFLQVGPLEKVSIPNDRHGRPHPIFHFIMKS
ncbi:uncharacterized protein CBL_07560 [Carabus blaptoides fortunei]